MVYSSVIKLSAIKNEEAKCIAEIVTVPGQINVDFEDVKTVMKNAGTSVLGSAESSGEDRAKNAIESAINSPLLNDRSIIGAKKILLNIVSGGGDNELTTIELNTITNLVNESSSSNVEIILRIEYIRGDLVFNLNFYFSVENLSIMLIAIYVI